MSHPRPPLLIGLCSPVMGSGKTQVANFLCDYYKFEPVKFAGALKGMTEGLLKAAWVPLLRRDAYLEGQAKETPIPQLGGATARRIMQTLGTEWGRQTMGEDFWVNLTMPTVDRLMRSGYSVVVDDLRFANEAAAILARGGTLVRVVRPDAPAYAAHASEGELDGVNMQEILNDGSLEDLQAKACLLATGELVNG